MSASSQRCIHTYSAAPVGVHTYMLVYTHGTHKYACLRVCGRASMCTRVFVRACVGGGERACVRVC